MGLRTAAKRFTHSLLVGSLETSFLGDLSLFSVSWTLDRVVSGPIGICQVPMCSQHEQ